MRKSEILSLWTSPSRENNETLPVSHILASGNFMGEEWSLSLWQGYFKGFAAALGDRNLLRHKKRKRQRKYYFAFLSFSSFASKN